MRDFRIKKSTLIHYLLIYLMLLSTRSALYYLFEDAMNYLIILICIVLSLQHSKLRKHVLFIFFVALAISLEFTRRIVGSGWGINYLLGMIAVSWITYVAYYYNPELFIERLLKLVAFFSGVSLICWLVLVFAPNLLLLITRKEYDLFYGSRGVLLFVYRYTQRQRGDFRNVGIFTEPGIYQVILNSVIYLLLFGASKINISPKKRIFYLLLFIITLLTTQSTTGYLAFAVTVAGYLIENKSEEQKIRKRMLTILLIGIMILGLNYAVSGQNSILYQTVIEKITTNSSLDFNASSGYYRVNSIIGGWNIFLQNPLGAGDRYYTLYQQIVSGHGSGGGLMVLLGSCGIITTLIVIIFNLFPAFKNRKSLIAFLIYVFLWINTALAQSMTIYSCILFLSLIEFGKQSMPSKKQVGVLYE